MGSGADDPQYDVSTSGAARSTPSTWLSPTRIVAEPVPLASPLQVRAPVPAPSTTAVSTTSTTVRDATTRVSLTSTTLAVTTTTVAGTGTVSTSTTTAPPASTTTTVAATTTTTRYVVSLPALSPLTPAAKTTTQSDRGMASWYNAPDRTCAHRTIPKGVIVKVTRVSTGESTTCQVADWGPADTSRVIDLSMDTFELLAHADTGLMEVAIEW